MNKCSRCQASISGGRRFCAPHYMEALADYQSQVAAYQHDMARWDSMTTAERVAARRYAESASVNVYAGFFGFVVGAAAWYLLAIEKNIDALIGIGILVISVLVFVVIKPIRILVGRLARLFWHAAGYFIGLWIVGAIISNWSPFIKNNSSILTVGLVIGVLCLSAVLEASGRHHASGMPTVPSKPSP